MAACSFWATGCKISSLNFSSTAALQPIHGLSTANKKLVQFDGLGISLRPNKALIGCQCSTSEASGSFWASGLKISSLNFCSTGLKLAALQPVHGLSTTNKKLVQCDGLGILPRPNKALIGFQCSTSEVSVPSKSDESPEDANSSSAVPLKSDKSPEDANSSTAVPSKSDKSPEDTNASTAVSKVIPNSFHVKSLLANICDTTSIAEFELNLGGFRLYVKRDLNQENTTLPAPVSAPVTVSTDIDLPNTNGSASSTSLVISKYEPASGDIQTLLDKAADDGISIVQSPRVGIFRRCRTIKDKLAPPSCEEKQQVKEGQVLCFIDQLGGEFPVESVVSGEVIKILREDGESVGYGDALIAVLPSFPGIKKLQ